MKFSKQYLCALVSVFAVTPYACGATKRLPSALRDQSTIPWKNLPEKTFLIPDLESVEEEDKVNRERFMAPRFAIPQEVRINPKQDGIWEELEDGSFMWRYVFNSPGCKSLNFGFTKFFLQEGTALFIYNPITKESLGPFTHEDNNENNELWTRVIKSCNLVVELDIDEKNYPDAVELEIGTVGIGYVEFGGHGSGERKLSGSCNLDVACPEANVWRSEVKAVAVYSLGGYLTCTGAMINNKKGDRTPYFVTATHCGVKRNNAKSLVVYWNYETSTCGGTPNGNLGQSQSGATHLLSDSTSDFTLLRLSKLPNTAWNVSYAGWDRQTLDPTTAVAIHHPGTDEKRISFEYDSTTKVTSWYGSSSPGDGTHIRVLDWDIGTTEPGSSGSPLFNQNHRIIGLLHGGGAACGNNDPDWYGYFKKAWERLTSLKVYLDPENTSALFVETLPGNA